MARPKENDFKSSIKKVLAERCGYRCSNPNCRKLTIGPKMGDPYKSQSLGEAAHIYSASNDIHAPRMNNTMSADEISHFDNGIWLCSGCARMIDNDEKNYPAECLKKWKKDTEAEAAGELQAANAYYGLQKDKTILSFYLVCFNRPAFKDDFFMETSTEDFLQALKDTVTALNTGVLNNREGHLLRSMEFITDGSIFGEKRDIYLGSNSISNPEWKEQVKEISILLSTMIRKVDKAQKAGDFSYDYGLLLIRDQSLPIYLNDTRRKIAEILDKIFREAQVGSFSYENRRF